MEGTRLSTPTDEELRKAYYSGRIKSRGHVYCRSGIYRQVRLGHCDISLQRNYLGRPKKPGEQDPPGFKVELMVMTQNRGRVLSRKSEVVLTLWEALQLHDRFELEACFHRLISRTYGKEK